jgi:hypothetical protein
VEYIFDEDGKQVRKVPIEMNGQTIWVECVEEGAAAAGGLGAGAGGGGVFKGPDSIIMDLNGESDGECVVVFLLLLFLLFSPVNIVIRRRRLNNSP